MGGFQAAVSFLAWVCVQEQRELAAAAVQLGEGLEEAEVAEIVANMQEQPDGALQSSAASRYFKVRRCVKVSRQSSAAAPEECIP